MAWYRTRVGNMIHDMQCGGFLVEARHDTQGTPVWHVYYPTWRHNGAYPNDQNTPIIDYAGKIVTIHHNQNRDRALRYLFDTPWFYAHVTRVGTTVRRTQRAENAAGIALRSRRNSVREEAP